MKKKQGILGLFDGEEVLLTAVKTVREKGYDVVDVFTPYPVHGLDDAMGIKRTRLAKLVYFYGLTGLLLGLLFQIWVFTQSWRMNIGGKSFTAIPALIPITFELMVLFAAVGGVFSLLGRCGLYPKIEDTFLPPSVTDDKFAVLLEAKEGFEEEQKSFLEKQGGEEIEVVDLS